MLIGVNGQLWPLQQKIQLVLVKYPNIQIFLIFFDENYCRCKGWINGGLNNFWWWAQRGAVRLTPVIWFYRIINLSQKNKIRNPRSPRGSFIILMTCDGEVENTISRAVQSLSVLWHPPDLNAQTLVCVMAAAAGLGWERELNATHKPPTE